MGGFTPLAVINCLKGRGFGEPLSLMLDIPADVALVNILKAVSGKLLVASDKGHGLVVDMDSAMAQTRRQTGSQPALRCARGGLLSGRRGSCGCCGPEQASVGVPVE